MKLPPSGNKAHTDPWTTRLPHVLFVPLKEIRYKIQTKWNAATHTTSARHVDNPDDAVTTCRLPATRKMEDRTVASCQKLNTPPCHRRTRTSPTSHLDYFACEFSRFFDLFCSLLLAILFLCLGQLFLCFSFLFFNTGLSCVPCAHSCHSVPPRWF